MKEFLELFIPKKDNSIISLLRKKISSQHTRIEKLEEKYKIQMKKQKKQRKFKLAKKQRKIKKMEMDKKENLETAKEQKEENVNVELANTNMNTKENRDVKKLKRRINRFEKIIMELKYEISKHHISFYGMERVNDEFEENDE
jgi:hypothetical protein